MRYLLTSLLFCCLVSGPLAAQISLKPKPVTATIVSEQVTIAPGKAFRVVVKLEHQPTFHTYGKTVPEGATGLPTSVTWKLPEGWKSEELPWPATHETESTGGTKVQGYSGTVQLPAKLTPPATLAPGATVKIEATVKGLVCDPQSCMPITLPVSLELKVGESPAVNPDASEAFKPFKSALVSELSTVAAAQPFRAGVRIELDPGWHIYAKVLPEGAAAKPTKVTWKLPEGWKVEELAWPATKDLKSTDGKTVPGYEGTVILPVRLTPPAGLPSNGNVQIDAKVDMLVCKEDTCMPANGQSLSITLPLGSEVVRDAAVAEAFDSPAPESSPSMPATPQQGVASLLLFAFVGGLILNVMPCVFPVLGIKILSVVNQAGGDQRKVFLHGLAYTLGVLVSFWALAGVLLALRAAGGNVGWGFQLQSPGFVFCLTMFLFVFGLNMAGVFEVGTSAVGVGTNLSHQSGLGGSFFSGLLATVVATPCAAPFLAPALAYALSLSALPSLAFFSIIGLGLASPYLLLSLFPKLVALLPRPGAWMESFKQAMSFLMFATVAFLLWTLMGMVHEHGQLNVLLGLVAVAIACWVYGRWNLPHKSKSTRAKGIIFTLVFFAGGIALGWPVKSAEWPAWSPEVVQKLRSEKKPVYIDFTARWCATCQTNKLVYHDKSLMEDFKNRGVAMLKADWTNYDERITEALKALDRAAVPVNVLYVPGREAPVILPNILTVDNVKAALAELDKKAS